MQTRGRVERGVGGVSMTILTASTGERNRIIPIGRTGGVAIGGDAATRAGIIGVVEDHVEAINTVDAGIRLVLFCGRHVLESETIISIGTSAEVEAADMAQTAGNR